MQHSSEDNYKQVLLECFESDSELLEKWHIESGTSLDNCINRTYNDLQECNVSFYVLKDNDKIIGYFGIENNNFLTGFFLKLEYRTKDNILEFWNIVDSKFEGNYMIGVYKKNEPAVEFLKKKTPVYFLSPVNNALYFVVNKRSS